MPADRFPGPATDLLQRAMVLLGRVANGEGIPASLDAGLRAILAAHEARDEHPVPSNIAVLTVRACLAAIGPASRHFGQNPLPSTIDFGLRSAGSLVQTLALPTATISSDLRQIEIPAWIDGTHILLDEADAATRWRRITERAEAAGAAVPAYVTSRLAGRRPALKLVSTR